ncbi:MAG: outer membrane beta-barrel protein [Robiginitomaculum sp.]
MVLFFSIIGCFSAQAQVSVKSAQTMSGIYGGLEGGYVDYKISGFAETFPPEYLARKRTNLNVKDNAAFLKGTLGFGHHWNSQLFTGLELSYTKLVSGTDILLKDTTIEHEVGVSYSSQIALSGIVGYEFTLKDMIYARLGYGFSNVRIAPRDTGGTGGAFHDLSGMIYGLGYARQINDKIALRIEAQRFSVADTYDNVKNDGEIYDIKIKDTRFSGGIIVSF